MSLTPDRYPGTREEEEILLEEKAAPPTVAGALRRVGNDLIFRDALGNFNPREGQIPKGTAFPGSPADWDLFFRTDLGVLFVWDPIRSKWLSAYRMTGGGYRNVIAGAGLVYLDGMNSTNGPLIPVDVTVTAFTLKNRNAVTRYLNFYKYDGATTTLIAQVLINGVNRISVPNANTDLAAGDMLIIAVDMTTGSGVLTQVFVQFHYAQRAS